MPSPQVDAAEQSVVSNSQRLLHRSTPSSKPLDSHDSSPRSSPSQSSAPSRTPSPHTGILGSSEKHEPHCSVAGSHPPASTQIPAHAAPPSVVRQPSRGSSVQHSSSVHDVPRGPPQNCTTVSSVPPAPTAYTAHCSV